ncbi:MAG: hypothetical protein ACTTKL_03345 [Treponema sp.]
MMERSFRPHEILPDGKTRGQPGFYGEILLKNSCGRDWTSQQVFGTFPLRKK